MFLIDVSYPESSLDDEARAAIAAQVINGFVGYDAAPESTMRRGRTMTHVAFHPAQSWTTGDGPLAPGQAPPFHVTVTVPEAWREEMNEHATGVIRGAIEQHDRAGGSTRTGGDVWINVVGIDDGSIGLNGKPSTADDVVLYMTEEYRANASEDDLPDGVVVDPICGMYVRLGPEAITLDHDGTVVGFCAQGCRSAYAREHGIEQSTS